MAIARSKLVDLSVSRWYHCITRCVRQASLLSSDGDLNRKEWISRRLQELDTIFAVSVGGFSVMDNHLHVLVRIDHDIAATWSAESVVDRWFKLCPPTGTDRKPLSNAQLQELRERRAADNLWVENCRARLGSLSWFMKCLKEPLARMANKADNCTGAFFEGRFKSIVVLDSEALLAVCAYIDLNPVAAGIAPTPEESEHTSAKIRVDHVKALGRTQDLKAAKLGSVVGSRASKFLEDELWLIPIEDRRKLDSQREGMIDGFTLGNYLMLVDYTGRLLREGKASIDPGLAGILDRIGSSAEVWQALVARLSGNRLFGRFVAGSQKVLSAAAEQLGFSTLRNLKAVRSG